MNRTALTERIRTLVGLSDAERADLLTMLAEQRTYGLTWEAKPEQVEEDLRAHLPVLCELPERRIVAKPKKEEAIAVTSERQNRQLSLSLADSGQTVSSTDSLDGLHLTNPLRKKVHFQPRTTCLSRVTTSTR